MEFKYTTLFAVWAVIIGLYLLFKFLNKPDMSLDKEINTILTSDKHKVK